jgi:hypothetical protein
MMDNQLQRERELHRPLWTELERVQCEDSTSSSARHERLYSPCNQMVTSVLHYLVRRMAVWLRF